MLSARDRIFLRDFADLGAKNHLYAALALQSAMVSPHPLVDGLKASDALAPAELSSEAQRTSEAGRFQVICQAKIFAEMVAAYEDFGALCSSIAGRRQHDIMVGYLQCSVGNVDRFYQAALKNEQASLEQLLNLPSLERVLQVVSGDLSKTLEASYAELPQIVRGAAQHYATIPDVSYDRALGESIDDRESRIHIFHEVRPVGTPRRAQPHRRIYEKLKHRFAVLTRLSEYAALGADHGIHGVGYPRTQDFLRFMIDHLDTTTRWIRDLPYMLLNLDDCGAL